MIFIETPVFEEDIQQLMPDDTYAEFQQHLADHPEAADVIQGTRRSDSDAPGVQKS